MKSLFYCVVAGLSLVRLAAAEEAAAKTHTLFMGADIALQQAKDFHHVENVEGGSFVIKVNGKDKKISSKFTKTDLKVDYALKLSETSATVNKLVVERGYTLGADPMTKFTREQAGGSAGAQLSVDEHKLAVLSLVMARANNLGGPSVGAVLMITGKEFGDTPGDSPGAIQAQYDAVERSARASAGALNSDINSAGRGANRMAAELAEEAFDAVDISFEVSAPQPLNSPYAVVLAQFKPPGAKPSEVQNWVYATELDPITPETRRIKIKQGGFPPGFQLKEYQLHLYNRGIEVATNVAPKRVPLTRDEAFDYVMLDYLAHSKGKTLPATLALGRLPAQLRNDLKNGGRIFVQVDPAGLPVAAFSDEACQQRLADPALEAEVAKLRFKPALKEGKTVAGVARLGS